MNLTFIQEIFGLGAMEGPLGPSQAAVGRYWRSYFLSQVGDPCPSTHVPWVVAKNLNGSDPETVNGVSGSVEIPANTTEWTYFEGTPVTYQGQPGMQYYADTASAPNSSIALSGLKTLWKMHPGQDYAYMHSPLFYTGSGSVAGTVKAGMPNPMYFTYNADEWSVEPTSIGLDGVYTVENDMYAATFYLQVDDGNFENWADIASQGAHTSLVPEHFTAQDTSYTFIDGRHYRVAAANENSMGTCNIWHSQIRLGFPYVRCPETLQFASEVLPLYGGTGTNEAFGQSFEWTLPTETPDTLACQLQYTYGCGEAFTGTPTDSLVLKIRSGGYDGAILATSRLWDKDSWTPRQVDPCNYDSNRSYHEFDNPPSLVNGVTYYLTIERTGERDTDNYWNIGFDDDTNYDGVAKIKGSGSWVTQGPGQFIVFFYTVKFDKFPLHFNLGFDLTTTGLQILKHFDPDEWNADSGTITFHHEQYGSSSSSSAKVQKDVDGTPTDITDSIATGANLARSSAMSGMPTSPDEIATYVVTTE